MKRLTLLTIVMLLTVATNSGCRTCSSLFNRNRGDDCNTCGGGAVAGAYDSYGSTQVYGGDTLLPPPTNVLPGPQPSIR